MKRVLAALFAIALVTTACGAKGDSGAASEEEPSGGSGEQGSDDSEAPTDADFGDLEAPCREGELTVDPDEAGKGTDKLYVGVGNDRSSTLQPGLQKAIWDASVAFARWCNDQGGIGGLEVELVDLDARLLEVDAAMARACTDVFAMVGGGMAQDNLQFTGKPATDFHACDLIDIPAYAVSTEKAESNGQVQPIPNPAHSVSNTWFRDFMELYPEAAESWVPVWGDLPSLEVVKLKQEAIAADVGLDQVGDLDYPIMGTVDWTPLAVQIKDSGATTMSWTGESANAATVLGILRDQGWEGTPILEANAYDPLFIESDPAGAEDSVIRLATHPLEEADEWPAVAKYLELVEANVADGEVSMLGMQSMSAWLLFATAANACGESNDGVLDRTCILEEAAAVDEWTGGGLHSTQDPEPGPGAVASPCSMLVVVTDGEFTRRWPDVGGEQDDGDGFHCPADGVTEVDADVGEGTVDPDRPI